MPRKPGTAGHEQSKANARQKLVEEFATLDREIDDLKPKLFRHSKLREIILSWYPEVPPEDEITVPGRTCNIVISARDKMRAVTAAGKRKLFQLWGPRQYLAKSHVQLKSLPDPEDPKGLYTEAALTGPRHLHVVEKSQPANAA